MTVIESVSENALFFKLLCMKSLNIEGSSLAAEM